MERYNTGDEGAKTLKRALSKSKPRKNPNMSDAECRLKYKGKLC